MLCKCGVCCRILVIPSICLRHAHNLFKNGLMYHIFFTTQHCCLFHFHFVSAIITGISSQLFVLSYSLLSDCKMPSYVINGHMSTIPYVQVYKIWTLTSLEVTYGR